MASPAGGEGRSALLGGPVAEACDPSIVMLPPSSVTADARVTAMNQSGLVGGISWDFEQNLPSHAVVWRDVGPPTELGIGGTVRANGRRVMGDVSDVNEAGVVAANRSVSSRRGRPLSSAAMLWDETAGATRLPAPPQRPKATVRALNDLGVAVGWASGPDKRQVPVYWRHGQVTRLPIPPKAEYGYAVDNNNHGLIVGAVVRDDQTSWPWWWRRGGRSGRLSSEGLRSEPSALDVDDRDRIVGQRLFGYDYTKVVLWRGPTARPRRIALPSWVAAMDDAGHLTGASGGFRGFDDRAWVARLRGAESAHLPDPPPDPPDTGWDNTFGTAVERGVTVFAPQGGLTVGGVADGNRRRAVLWTCAQTYLEQQSRPGR